MQMLKSEVKKFRIEPFVRSERVVQQLANPAVKERLKEKIKTLEIETKPLMDAIRSSEHLSEQDFAIRINTKS